MFHRSIVLISLFPESCSGMTADLMARGVVTGEYRTLH